MLSDRLVDALSRSRHRRRGVGQALQARASAQLKEIFLRFTHRYWFHEISDQAQARALYRMCREALDTERLFAEVREEIQDMSEYLDSDSLRRQVEHGDPPHGGDDRRPHRHHHHRLSSA